MHLFNSSNNPIKKKSNRTPEWLGGAALKTTTENQGILLSLQDRKNKITVYIERSLHSESDLAWEFWNWKENKRNQKNYKKGKRQNLWKLKDTNLSLYFM